MSSKRYTEEFKIQAVKHITESGHSVSEVGRRLGVTTKSLYSWLERYGDSREVYQQESASQAEIKRLQKELKRVTQERDILKEAAAYFAGESKKGTRS